MNDPSNSNTEIKHDPFLAHRLVQEYDRGLDIKLAKANIWSGAVMAFGSSGFLIFLHPDVDPIWMDAFGSDCMPVVQGVCISLFAITFIAGTALIIRGAVVLSDTEISVRPAVCDELKTGLPISQGLMV